MVNKGWESVYIDKTQIIMHFKLKKIQNRHYIFSLSVSRYLNLVEWT